MAEETKSRILRALYGTDGYVSGQDLCGQLGISRAAVWKYMKQLKDEGYAIEAAPNRGYRLVDSPDVLSGSGITSRLETEWIGRPLHFYAEIDSTNTEAKRLAEEGAPSGTLVVSDCQTRGKGRRGRSWDSPKGSSVYFTLLLRPEFDPDRASMLTLVMGLSAAQAIRDTLGIEAQIKWPNDVVLNRKKAVGILTEMSAQIHYIEYLVIGVGVNCNRRAFPEELRNKATSLEEETGRRVNRPELVAAMMRRFEENYAVFVKTQDLSGLRDSYEAILANRNQPVRVLSPGDEYSGTALGIDSMGELLVRREGGSVERVFAGEVSVRGLYSYV